LSQVFSVIFVSLAEIVAFMIFIELGLHSDYLEHWYKNENSPYLHN